MVRNKCTFNFNLPFQGRILLWFSELWTQGKEEEDGKIHDDDYEISKIIFDVSSVSKGKHVFSSPYWVHPSTDYTYWRLTIIDLRISQRFPASTYLHLSILRTEIATCPGDGAENRNRQLNKKHQSTCIHTWPRHLSPQMRLYSCKIHTEIFVDLFCQTTHGAILVVSPCKAASAL